MRGRCSVSLIDLNDDVREQHWTDDNNCYWELLRRRDDGTWEHVNNVVPGSDLERLYIATITELDRKAQT